MYHILVSAVFTNIKHKHGTFDMYNQVLIVAILFIHGAFNLVLLNSMYCFG